MNRVVTVIDLGSNKIAASQARIAKNGSVFLLGMENLYSRGIAGGEITDINKAVEDIKSVMKKLLRHGKKSKNVFVTTKGFDIRMDISRGMVPLSKTPREITKKDVKKCLEIASMVKLSPERDIVEKVIKSFYIDEVASGVKNPVGLYGVKLEVEAFIATVKRSKIQNITKCIDHAGFLLDGIRLSGMASADGVLDVAEKEKGVLLIDMGDTLTEAAGYKNGMLKNFRVIKKGVSSVLDGKMRLERRRLSAFFKDTLSAVEAGEGDFFSTVVTGGGALLDGVIEEAEKSFNVPSRIGFAKKAGRELNAEDAIIHAATVGLISRLAEEHKASRVPTNPIHKAFHKIIDIYESYF